MIIFTLNMASDYNHILWKKQSTSIFNFESMHDAIEHFKRDSAINGYVIDKVWIDTDAVWIDFQNCKRKTDQVRIDFNVIKKVELELSDIESAKESGFKVLAFDEVE